ncbi:MAG: amino acid ABC transporter permease [Caldilineales bacterium]|nr:amino acid ABC transporter permease [Caldilineales bacterium]MDW8317120.1 amino acid ABC transporter permease [Anaerolineae bacterium]
MTSSPTPLAGSGRSRLLPLKGAWDRVPLWLVAAVLLAAFFLWTILTDADYRVIFDAVVQGIGVTIRVSIVAYAAAVLLGLMVGLMRVSSRRLTREAASFYVEILRGVPMLVLLYYVVFAGAPGAVQIVNATGELLLRWGVFTGLGQSMADLNVRAVDFTFRVIVALSIGYSAFLAEIFRAGIQSIERGQMEAARSLGMTYWQAMRYVILPQAVRRVLPPLGNDFIAMLKDSSLVSVMGVADITYQGKVYAASTFKFFETYNVVAFLYLVMTIGLALLVRYVERRMPQSRH